MLQEQMHARAVRKRLMNPQNAVQDHGINLRNGYPVRRPPPELVVKPIPPQPVAQEVEVGMFTTAMMMTFEPTVPQERRYTIKEIQVAVCKHFGVSLFEMLSHRRTMNLVRPRQVAMYLAKNLTSHSLPEIGRRFSGRDHTTVLHSVKKVETRQEYDADLANHIQIITAQIKGD